MEVAEGVKVRYPFLEIFLRRRAPFGQKLGESSLPVRSPIATILFVPFSAEQGKLESDWAVLSTILRRCPCCNQNTIVGHGRRRKQAHDQDHDWISVRRGRCPPRHQTFTFLPQFSPPYGHYSLIARSEALRRHFVEGCSWEAAAPLVKDPDRVPAASTLRRWFRRLDFSQPPFYNLRRAMQTISHWLRSRTEMLVPEGLPALTTDMPISEKSQGKVGFKIGFNKRPTRRNSRVTPALAEFRMNNIPIDLEIRNQQVSGSSPEGGSIPLILLLLAVGYCDVFRRISSASRRTGSPELHRWISGTCGRSDVSET
jgi:hypothetical protein